MCAKALIAAISELPAQTVALYRKPGTAFGPPGPYDRPSATCLHANQESVRTLALHN
jgi:hypothetical protein